jgi:multicomponent Na+:H+ antiporter subunit G
MMQAMLPWLIDALIIAGLVIMSIAIYGMLWLPDLYTRLHAASKAAFLGVLPLLIVVSITGEPAFFYRSILIGVFLILTTPVGAHAMARAAFLKRERLETPGAVDESGHHLAGGEGQ